MRHGCFLGKHNRAAVIQRGGSFLSGSFVNKSWAEDAAGRSTVCLTRSISYTALISPIEMMGMFGMAQVIGAKTHGVEILTPDLKQWRPPLIVLNRTDEELMQMCSIDKAPHWAEVPLAIRYQAQEPMGGSRTKEAKAPRQGSCLQAEIDASVDIHSPYTSKIQEQHISS